MQAIKADDRVIIKVIDTGIGISLDQLKKLFTTKEIKSTLGTENGPGTGFGLILTKEFIEMNQGKIEVESIKGKGTTFRFDLPFAK